MKEIITLKGETDSENDTGDFPLYGDIVYGSTTSFRIPAGLKAKVWAKRISGVPVTVNINYTRDITANAPTWVLIDSENLAEGYGELTLEKRRPVVLRGLTGKEAFKVSWSQTVVGESHIMLEVEITDED
jgi:hypothetical protein